MKQGTVVVLRSPQGNHDTAIKTRDGWALAGESPNATYKLEDLTSLIGEIVATYK